MSDDLEKLFAEASLPGEASLPTLESPAPEPAPEGVVTNDMHCVKCTAQAVTHVICPTCKGPFCDACASILDPSYCRNCLNEPLAELQELPLKDAEGVTHAGRILIPKGEFYQPRFGTLAKSISEMSDYELDSHIEMYKDLVRQGEKALDFRRVVLGSMQIEGAQRADAKRRQMRSDKTKYPVRTVAVDANGKKKVSTASMTQMLEMLKALDTIQKAKVAKQAQAQSQEVKKSPNETA